MKFLIAREREREKAVHGSQKQLVVFWVGFCCNLLLFKAASTQTPFSLVTAAPAKKQTNKGNEEQRTNRLSQVHLARCENTTNNMKIFFFYFTSS